MYKRLATFLALSAIAAFSVLPAASLAQDSGPFQVKAARQFNVDVDRVFEFDIVNSSVRDLFARGRVVLLNVYDASLPVTILVPDVHFPPGSTTSVSVRWPNAPLVGQIRALLVLNDGQDPSLIQQFTFWVFPLQQAALFVGIAAMACALALTALRLPKYLKTRVPANMIAYIVDDDDTVVTLSTRFDVTWQDIVRANRLNPPYALKQGQRIFIPKHGLRQPDEKI